MTTEHQTSRWNRRGTIAFLKQALLVAVLALTALAAQASTVHDFPDPIVPGDGRTPVAGLVQDTITGRYFGVTRFGGKFRQGTVFRMDPVTFAVTILYHFSGPDGAEPTGTLILSPPSGTTASRTLYGTTLRGGSFKLGTVFKIKTNATGFLTLHHFFGAPNDGANPYAGVILATNKRLYGTTLRGGNINKGTVYSLSTAGGATTIHHSFQGILPTVFDGERPYARLLEYKPGMLVGTTALGGRGKMGTVYTIGLGGIPYAVTHHFIGGWDGANPTAELIWGVDSSGAQSLYGTTVNGGPTNLGTIYQIDPSGFPYSVLYNFVGAPMDGANPWSGLLQARNGLLYGTTRNGGNLSQGTLFKMQITPFAYGMIYSFSGPFGAPPDGAYPLATLIESVTDGKLYGTASDEGVNLDGTAYSFP